MHDMNIHVKNKYARGALARVPSPDISGRMPLKDIRNRKKLTQIQLAELAGVEQATISRIENGSPTITMRQLRKVAEALKVPPADLIDDERTQDEQLLIEVFRGLPSDRQRGWLDMAVNVQKGLEKPTEETF